jgi:hypothetical protein
VHTHVAGEDSRGGAGPRCTDGLTLDRKEVAEGGGHPRCTDGHTPAGGSGEERAGGGERRYPSTLHRRAPSSHQESRERRLSPRKRLRIIGSCSSLNSQKESIPTQSPPSAVRKIRRGRARGPRAEASRQSYVRELRPSSGARLRFCRTLFRALVRERTLFKFGYAWVRGRGIS